MHKGIDIAVPVGTPVHSTGNGVVVRVDSKDSSGYGKQIVIDHGNGVQSQYAHLSKSDVKVGDKVVRDQPIGLSGDSGNARGHPHVHYEERENGQPRDPNFKP
jgi:murein DD-endopeptidase MepM/ murein hydrolase activator NlpD